MLPEEPPQPFVAPIALQQRIDTHLATASLEAAVALPAAGRHGHFQAAAALERACGRRAVAAARHLRRHRRRSSHSQAHLGAERRARAVVVIALHEQIVSEPKRVCNKALNRAVITCSEKEVRWGGGARSESVVRGVDTGYNDEVRPRQLAKMSWRGCRLQQDCLSVTARPANKSARQAHQLCACSELSALAEREIGSGDKRL